MSVARLITMPASNFSEKARWALDRARIPYIEERHANILHKGPVRRAGGQGTVPVLVAGGATYPDSNSILRWVDEQSSAAGAGRLFPDDPAERAEVDEVITWCDERVAMASARWIFAQSLEGPTLARRITTEGVPAWERRTVPLLLPIARHILYRNRRANPGRVESIRKAVSEALDGIADRLRDGRPYLAGDRFTAADITFAALSSLLFLPPQFGGARIDPDELPLGRVDVDRWREHPAGKHALAMYEKHRWS